MIIRFARFFSLLVGLILLMPCLVLAQDVTLRAGKDGSTSLTGRLLDFDGEFYRIETSFGVMTLNALGLTCHGLDCPEPGQYSADLFLSGDPSVLPGLLPALIEDFSQQNGLSTHKEAAEGGGWVMHIADATRVPVARIEGHSANRKDTFYDLIDGRADLVFTFQSPNRAERSAFKIAGLGDPDSRFRQIRVALDGLSVLVSPNNAVKAISAQQLGDIFAGRINNWSDLGGVNAPITVILPDPDSGISELSQSVFSLPVGLSDAPNAQPPADGLTAESALASDPFGITIGLVSQPSAARPLAIIQGCGIRQLPSAFNLKTGDYPGPMTLRAFKPARRLPVFGRSFLRYLSSPSASAVIKSAGFADLGIEHLLLTQQQTRLMNAIQMSDADVSLTQLRQFTSQFSDAARLSYTMRFRPNSARLTTQSEEQLRALAALIEVGAFEGRTLILAGFTDSDGEAEANQRVAARRAEIVKTQLKRAASRANLSKTRFQSLGFGELAPIACNDTDGGKFQNRRVEIWVR